ncbi:hypothetical protein BIY27_23565 [Gibbsiella quercinecans]|nr:hypothetical protein BIY27_23565 [Gibbsiella quercinecans]
MPGNGEDAVFPAVDCQQIAIFYNLRRPFIGSFLRPINHQAGVLRNKLFNAAYVVMVMVGKQNGVRDQLPALERGKHGRGFAGVDDDAVPFLVIQ